MSGPKSGSITACCCPSCQSRPRASAPPCPRPRRARPSRQEAVELGPRAGGPLGRAGGAALLLGARCAHSIAGYHDLDWRARPSEPPPPPPPPPSRRTRGHDVPPALHHQPVGRSDLQPGPLALRSAPGHERLAAHGLHFPQPPRHRGAGESGWRSSSSSTWRSSSSRSSRRRTAAAANAAAASNNDHHHQQQ